MADVFISYKSERREAAEHLSRILEIYGYSVWFDYHLLSGRNFGQSIEGEIRQAKAAIVLWCSRSIGSHWVQEEASLARDLQTILPVKIEKVDLPLGFRTLDTIDVTAWNGSPRSDSVDKLLTEVGRLVGREPASTLRDMIEFERTWHRYGALTLAQFALDPKAEAVERKRESMSVPPPPTTLAKNQLVIWRDAHRGNASAQFKLGRMLANGTGVTKDEREAVVWYRKAADQDNASAQVNLGFMLANGTGVTKDEREAVVWYRKAAEQGNAIGQVNLASCSRLGAASRKTSARRSHGIARPLNRVMRSGRPTWAPCSTLGAALRKTSVRRLHGIARPL